MDENKFEHLSNAKKVLVTIVCFIHIAVWSVCKAASYLALFAFIGSICAVPLYFVLTLVGIGTGISITLSVIVGVFVTYVIESIADSYMTEEEKKKYFS